MAQVNFFKFDSDGFQVEHDPTADDVTIASLTLDAAGAGINMNATKITNLAAGTAASDAVRKDQLDAVAAGLDPKESARLKTSGDYSTWTSGGSGIGATLTSPSTVTANNDFDGVTAVVGDRILVTGVGGNDTTANADNGLYTVTQLADGGANSTILTRATDQDEDAEYTAGNCVFVSEGTAHADQIWCVITNDPITVDTTAVQWSQISAVSNLNFDAGLVQTGQDVDIELDTGADAQGAGADGGSSGLEFDITGAAGKLRVRVDAAGGVQRTASGLALEIDDTPDTLDVDADGLKVVGLPSLFKVNDVAVGATVTAANFDTLTNGSNADALHVHSGADEAQRIENAYTSDGTGVTKGDPVFVSANDVVSSCNANNNNTRKFIGIAKATVGASAAVDVVGSGVLTGVTVAGSPSAGDIVFLAVGGGLTVTLPTGSGNHRLVVGKMKNATDIDCSQTQYLGKIN